MPGEQEHADQEDVEDAPEPDIDDDDRADGADIFDAVDPDADLDDADDSDDAQEDVDADDQEEETSAASDDSAAQDPLGMAGGTGEGVTIGDVYCNGLGLAAAAAVGSFGDESDPRSREELMNEYGGLARDLELDQYVNEAVATHGGPADLPPAHAAVLMTVVLAASIAVSEPDAANNILSSIKDDA